MNNSLAIEILQEKFSAVFDRSNLEYRCTDVGFGNAHSFFVTIESASQLAESWRKISNFVALEFQNRLQVEFERWNIYLFFLQPKELDDKKHLIELKSQIENDTFSNRKILVDCEEDLDSIIRKYVLYEDMDLNTKRNLTEETVFTPNLLIWEQLSGQVVKKKIRTSTAHEVLDGLILKIRESEK